MSLSHAEHRYSVEEYLSRERADDERHEYLEGQIYAMAGESLEHGIIRVNLTRIISNQLTGTPCQALSKDIKVRSGPRTQSARSARGMFSYPDLLVVCGEPKFHDQHRDVLTNPQVIIEVLSPTTEAYDRGQKFLRYRAWLASLTDYLLISQNEPVIEPFHKSADDQWIIRRPATGLSESVEIKSIGVTLESRDVFDRISFQSVDQAGGSRTEESRS